MASSSADHISIKNINENLRSVSICGLIIAKTDARFFGSSEIDKRGVITFTVRDSAQHFINCVCWGSQSFITVCMESNKIGDIIEVHQCRVITRPSGANFQPYTSSPYQLVLNEDRGSIVKSGHREVNALRQIPVKPTFSVLSLKDLNQHACATCVDLLVVVSRMKPIKEFVTKDGNRQHLREIIVVDRSITTGVSLTIWTQGIIDRSHCWTSMKTALHLVDVKVVYSEFYKQIALSSNSRTIIIENPKTKEGKCIQDFARTLPHDHFSNFDSNSIAHVNLNAITTVMSVQQILDRIDSKSFDSDDKFTSLTYAVVTTMDLDGPIRVFTRKCTQCHSYMRDEVVCPSTECQSTQFTEFFDLRLAVSDHSGTISFCRLFEKAAEKALGVSLAEFQDMDECTRCSLKWKYLLERCAIKFVVHGKNINRRRVMVTIAEIRVADTNEVTENAKVY